MKMTEVYENFISKNNNLTKTFLFDENNNILKSYINFEKRT